MLNSIIKLIRPHQYIKNIFIFMPIFFIGHITNIELILITTTAFVAFSISASAVYIFNDYQDIDDDRKHPEKKHRPLASGSITKTRDIKTQAVFSLRGKPLNSYGLTKKVVYENEEFNLLQAALNIETGIDDLRYNKIVIATDADVDGMHIRLLLLTFFLQFFPELVKEGHVYILETPLFRVRNKKKTIYCYSEEERRNALEEIGKSAEITRFKGLGEISPNEFKHFIGPEMRLDPVILAKEDKIQDLLKYFMGKNTKERQDFIIDNLRVEENIVDA